MEPGARSNMIEFFGDVLGFFTTADNWTGAGGVPGISTRLWEHIQISVFATGLGAAVAIPPAMWLGHRRKGTFLAVSAVNIGRAVPSFAIVAISLPITIRLGLGLGFWPTFLALFALALPPIFVNTLTGVAEVDDAVVEAGRGMGMTEGELLRRVELPIAAPIILAGVRVAAVQVVATAPLGALVGWGGLGRFIIDGFAQQDNVEVFVGGLLVALLAGATELALGWVQRRSTPGRASSVERREPEPTYSAI